MAEIDISTAIPSLLAICAIIGLAGLVAHRWLPRTPEAGAAMNNVMHGDHGAPEGAWPQEHERGNPVNDT